jgi:hypothetical protein
LNIQEALVREHSKTNTLAIVSYIGQDKKLFKELIDVFKSGDHLLIQRAAWPLGLMADKNPQLVYPHLGVLLKWLDKPLHDAYTRNVFRLLRSMDEIPEKHHGIIIDHCMSAMTNMYKAAAIRAFAIHIMGKMLIPYPELSNELRLVLEPLSSHELASIRSSAKHVLKQIAKITV